MSEPSIINFRENGTWDDFIKVSHPNALNFNNTTVEFTQTTDIPRITVCNNAELYLQGGVHVNPYFRFNGNADDGSVTRVDISGNIYSNNVQLFCDQFTSDGGKVAVSMSLHGFWGASYAALGGNLGFDFDAPSMPVDKPGNASQEKAKDAWLAIDSSKTSHLPSIVFSSTGIHYGVDSLMCCSTDKGWVIHEIASFELASKVIEESTEIRQFCAYKDTHIRPNCRCALYDALLLIGDPLATAYYLKAHPSLKHLVPTAVENVPVKHMEGILEEKVIAITQKYDTRDKLVEYVKENILIREDFKAHLNQYGVGDSHDLCYPHNNKG